jgi:hypothetical protein
VTSFGLRAPEFGRTQYLFGAVVFILKYTFLFVGLINFMYDVTGPPVKGPVTKRENCLSAKM